MACIGCAFLQGTSDANLQLLSVEIFSQNSQYLLTLTQVVLSLIGKFGASAVWGIVFVYTAEMFPTVIRNQAVGACSLVARLGGILSMLLDLLKVYWLPAPVFIMGVVATVAGALAIFFPETLGEKLPESMEDALSIGSGQQRGFCTFTCFDIREQYGEELKTVPVNSAPGVVNNGAITKE